jgi:hypothetical protein
MDFLLQNISSKFVIVEKTWKTGGATERSRAPLGEAGAADRTCEDEGNGQHTMDSLLQNVSSLWSAETHDRRRGLEEWGGKGEVSSFSGCSWPR